MLEIFEYMFVVFGEYNSYDKTVCDYTKQADEISEYFDYNLNFLVKDAIILCSPNFF